MDGLRKYFLMLLLPIFTCIVLADPLYSMAQDLDTDTQMPNTQPNTTATSSSHHRKKRVRSEDESSSTTTEYLDRQAAKRRLLDNLHSATANTLQTINSNNNSTATNSSTNYSTATTTPSSNLSSAISTNQIDSDVNQIYFNVCKKIGVSNGKSILENNNVDVKLDNNVSLFPISPIVKTQSINHIRYILGDKKSLATNNLTENDLNNLLNGNIDAWKKQSTLDNESISQIAEICNDSNMLPKMLKNVLAKEKEYHDKGYRAFYHAHTGGVTFYEDLYHFLNTWFFLNKDTPLTLRSFIAEEVPHNITHFLNLVSTNMHSHQGKYSFPGKYAYCDSNNKEIVCNIPYLDHMEHIQRQCLSVNLSLFGNNNNLGESTLLFFEGNDSAELEIVSDSYVQIYINELFKKMNIPKKFTQNLINIYRNNDIENTATPKLLQIFIKNEVVNEVAYLSFAGGVPLIDGVLQNKKISEILEQYITNPTHLNQLLLSYPINQLLSLPEAHLDLDIIQARLWLPSRFLYNPAYTKIFRYSLDPEDNYKQKIAEVFENIIKDRIKKIISGEISVPTKQDTPFDQFVTHEVYNLFMQKIINNKLTESEQKTFISLVTQNLNMLNDLFSTLEKSIAQKQLPDAAVCITAKLTTSQNIQIKQRALNFLALTIRNGLGHVAVIKIAQEALVNTNPESRILGLQLLTMILKNDLNDPYSLSTTVREQCFDQDPNVSKIACTFLEQYESAPPAEIDQAIWLH